MLDIRLLGTPRIFLDRKPISIPRKTTRALLFYLAMHPNGVNRGLLAEYLGGKGDDKKKRTTLRRYLNHLRNSLDKKREFVINYHDIVRLDANLVEVDALKLSAVAEEVYKNNGSYHDSGRTIPIAVYQRVEDIIAELGGEGFIESTDLDAFEDLSQWKMEKDATLKNEQKLLFTFLAETDSQLGRTERAIEWAKRALKFGETEGAYYALIKGFRDLGDFSKAQKRYQEAEELFEYGVSTRIKELGGEIADIEEANPLYVRPVWAIRPSVSIPFVGQSEILRRMQTNYQRGIGSLLVGEAGAGKTRLVQQFFEKLPMTPNLLLVPCYKDNENLPYQPWIDMLRYSFRKEFWQTTPTWWTNALSMLLPELHEYRDDLNANRGDVFSNALVFEAFKNLLTHANKKSAALLFVEDAQWMDRVSFDLLKYLIQHSTFTQWNIGLVITSRLGINAVADYFNPGAIQGKIDEIEISPLSNKEIRYLSFYLLNKTLSNEKIERLQKMTGGNPFFLLEMLGFQASHSDVDIFETFGAAPPSVRQFITARLDTLSPNTRKLLNYAAIQGNHFALSILEEVLAMSLEEMHAAITELTNMRLVHFVKKDVDLQYAFVHEMLREEVINSLSPIDLHLMHAKLATVLSKKSIYQDEKAAVLAEHYEGAGELQKAFFLWFAAAKHAYNIFSPRDAETAYKRAKELLSHINLQDEDIRDFYLSWQIMLFYTDNPDALEEVMQGLLIFARRRGSTLLIGVALDGLSDVRMMRNQFEEGLELVEEALAYLIMAAHIPAQMVAYNHQGVFLYMLNNFPASLNSFKTALSLGTEKTDPKLVNALGEANYQMATSLTGMGYPREAIRYAKESLHITRISNVPHGSILPHSILGLANYYLGHYDEGRQQALSSLILAKKADYWRMAGYAAAYAGMNESQIPELGLAWQHAQDAIHYGKKYGHTEIVGMGYKIIGDIYSRLEAPLRAAEAYQHGLSVDKDSFMTAENAARLGVTLGLLGDPNADALLAEALAGASAAGLEGIEFNARALQLSLFITRKDYDSFDANQEIIRTTLTERSHPKGFVWIDYLQSQRLYQEDKLDEALALLEKTLLVLEETEFFWIRLHAQRLYYRLLKTLGRDTTQSRKKIKEMLTIIESSLSDAPLQEEWQLFSEKVRDT